MVEDDDREPVLLDLGPAVERVDESLEDRGIDLTDDDPMDEVGEVVALRHSQIDEVRETVDHAGGLVSTLPMVAIALITQPSCSPWTGDGCWLGPASASSSPWS